MSIDEWIDDTIEQWATYDDCPCGSARRSHAEFVRRRVSSREHTPDVNAPLESLGQTKSGAELEQQAVEVLGVLSRVAGFIIDDRIFMIRSEINDMHKPEEPDSGDAKFAGVSDAFIEQLIPRYRAGETFIGFLSNEEIDELIAWYMRKRNRSAKHVPDLKDVLGESTIDIVNKIDLLDKGRFDKWIGEVKAAVAVIYKKGKTDDDILTASEKLAELMSSESTKAFLRMLDFGLFGAVADKIDKAKNGLLEHIDGDTTVYEADYFDDGNAHRMVPVADRRAVVYEELGYLRYRRSDTSGTGERRYWTMNM